MRRGSGLRLRTGDAPGQAMVEFVLCFLIFILFVFGIIDISRLIFDEHGLTRATEAIAHTLAADYQAATPAQPFQPYDECKVDLRCQSIIDAITQAHADSDLGLDSALLAALPADPVHPQTQTISNSTIKVCASPNFTSPNVIKVTINAGFDSVLGKLVGGQRIHMSQTATVITYIGELNSGTYQTTCP